MKNQISLKWSVWSHTWNRVATPNPVLHPAKSSSGLLNHYPIIHVRAESSAANNARQTKGRRCVYLCPAHVWEVQMQLFIYNPPNVPVVHSWKESDSIVVERRQSLFLVDPCALKRTGRAREEWRERSCVTAWPQTQQTSAHQAGQRPNISTAGAFQDRSDPSWLAHKHCT